MIKELRKADIVFMRQVLAENLQRIRKEGGLSQERVEELTGVSTNEIGKIESKRTSAGLDTLTTLAAGLGMEVKRLLDPGMDPAAVFLRPEKEVMEQLSEAMKGLPEKEQRHIARLVMLHAEHYRHEQNSRPNGRPAAED